MVHPAGRTSGPLATAIRTDSSRLLAAATYPRGHNGDPWRAAEAEISHGSLAKTKCHGRSGKQHKRHHASLRGAEQAAESVSWASPALAACSPGSVGSVIVSVHGADGIVVVVTTGQPPVAPRHARARCRVAQQKRLSGVGRLNRVGQADLTQSDIGIRPNMLQNRVLGNTPTSGCATDELLASSPWPCRDARRPRPMGNLITRSVRSDGWANRRCGATAVRTHTHTHEVWQKGRGGGANARINSCRCFSRTTSLAQRPLDEETSVIRSFCLVGLGRAPPLFFFV